MAHILITHRVNDYGTWKKEFENFADVRKSSGEKSFIVLHPEENPNNLTLLFEWDSARNAEKFLASPELKSAMQRAGVVEEPTIQMLSPIAQGTL